MHVKCRPLMHCARLRHTLALVAPLTLVTFPALPVRADATFTEPTTASVSLYPAMSLAHNNVHGVRYNLLPGLVYTDAWIG
jgi:hypothetical protein